MECQAYDWDEFMKIPGCQTGGPIGPSVWMSIRARFSFHVVPVWTGHCTDVTKDKKFLGGADLRPKPGRTRSDPGADLRAENAPKRLDDEVPVDPRKKLDRFERFERFGFVSLVGSGGFGRTSSEKAW